MRIVFFLLLFLLSVNSWGACQPWSYYASGFSEANCRSGNGMPAGVTCEWVSCNKPTGNRCYHYPEGFTGEIDCRDYLQAGGSWINCKICDDEPDPCDSYRTQCEQAKGVFSGSANNGCCIATCNQCGALKDAVSQKAQMCCNQGMAPPDQARQCRVEARATCGMNWSTFLSNDNEFSCQSPSASAEASQRYADQCFDNSSSSTSDPSSSSGGGGSSGGDCPECPILEEILSTLTDQKGTVEEIYRCLSVPGMCDLAGDSLPPWVREKMDQMISYDSMTVNRAESIDSVVRVIMESQKSLVKSDSLTRETIKDGVDSIVNAISDGLSNDSLGEYIDRIANLIGTNSQMLSHHLDSIKERIPGSILDSILANQKSMFGSFENSDSLTREIIKDGVDSIVNAISNGVGNDSLGEYIDRIANLIGTNSQMLSDHLDLILERIPGSILDSILANQKSMFDSFDSAFWNIGNGFEKIDNLTDSAIKYFNQGFHYDSVYSSLYRDSLGEIHAAINSLSNSIGYALGYGDTATTTLRGDLAGIKGGLDDLNGKFVASSVDSGAVGYGSGFIADGERYSDSLARAIGWLGGLDGVNVDSVFRQAIWETSGVDSVNDFVNDTLGSILDSLYLQLKSENDSIKGSLPDSLTVWADSLIKVSPFVSFDSLIYSTIGARIPNSDQCPEDCQSWSLSLPRFGLINYTVDFGLCLGRVPLGGLNVLGFLRLIIRLVIVWSCISIVMWTFSHRKM